MNSTIRSVFIVSLMTTTLGFTVASNTKAENLRLPATAMELAYASPQSTTDDRFAQFENEEELHELNDAWLGMPAISKEGKIVGFVEDAFVDEFGNVSEILVGLPERRVAVFVDGTNVTLNDINVAIDLTNQEFAALESTSNISLAQN